jgi:adenylosuccinate synthase
MNQVVKNCISGRNSKFCVIVGGQWGDEGKGKLVDILAEKFDFACRFNGGNNAGLFQIYFIYKGHTIVADNKKFFFHQLPSGALYPHVKNILGNGVVVHL